MDKHDKDIDGFYNSKEHRHDSYAEENVANVSYIGKKNLWCYVVSEDGEYVNQLARYRLVKLWNVKHNMWCDYETLIRSVTDKKSLGMYLHHNRRDLD